MLIDTNLSKSSRKAEPQYIKDWLVSAEVPVLEADLYKLCKAGDYVILTADGQTIGIERKTAGDLFSSMSSRRLEKQMEALADAFDVPILLIEGSISRSIDGRVIADGRRREWWYSYFAAWQLHQGYRLWFLADKDATASALLNLEKWASTHTLEQWDFASIVRGAGRKTEVITNFLEVYNAGPHIATD